MGSVLPVVTRPGAQDAQTAAEQTNGYEMDKRHKWQVCMFDDFDKLDKVPDDYEEPPTEEYKQLVRDSPCSSLPIKLHCRTCCCSS